MFRFELRFLCKMLIFLAQWTKELKHFNANFPHQLNFSVFLYSFQEVFGWVFFVLRCDCRPCTLLYICRKMFILYFVHNVRWESWQRKWRWEKITRQRSSKKQQKKKKNYKKAISAITICLKLTICIDWVEITWIKKLACLLKKKIALTKTWHAFNTQIKILKREKKKIRI